MSQDDLTGMYALMAFLPIFIAVALIPIVFYLLTLQKALKRCDPSLRTMVPGQVWLCLVPVFNLIWPFFVVNALSNSLHHEFTRRGILEEPQPGRTLGMATAILVGLTVLPLVGYVTGVPALVCWILYWVKIAGFSEKIAAPYAAGVPAGV